MNRISLITALSLGLSGLSFSAYAQTAPATPDVPPATTTETDPVPATPPANPTTTAPVATTGTTPAAAGFVAPEGYSMLPDWTTVTADQLKGAEVYHAADGASVGEISDISLSTDGAVNGVIIDVGGFLGMGVHTVALSGDQVSLYSNEGDVIAATSLDKDALKALPAYVAPAQ